MSRRLSMENVAILKVNKLGKEKKDKKPGLELRINWQNCHWKQEVVA